MDEAQGIQGLMAKIEKPKIKIDTEPLKKLEKQLENFGKFLDKKNEIFARICKAITPLARQLMLQSLHKSSIHLHSGTSGLEGLVSGIVVLPTRKGIRIAPPRGKSVSEYAKMGALNSGRLHGVHGLSAKSRQKVKKSVKAGLGPTGAKATRAFDYFALDNAQVAQLESAFQKELQIEIDRAGK